MLSELLFCFTLCMYWCCCLFLYLDYPFPQLSLKWTHVSSLLCWVTGHDEICRLLSLLFDFHIFDHCKMKQKYYNPTFKWNNLVNIRQINVICYFLFFITIVQEASMAEWLRSLISDHKLSLTTLSCICVPIPASSVQVSRYYGKKFTSQFL